MTGAPPRGVLHAVVGPSGVGKDSLIDAARAARPDLLVPIRVITRPEGAGGETHVPCTPEDFARRAAAGEFLLHWGAHGLFYGIPQAAEAALAAGRHVLANLSRKSLDEARRRAGPVRILAVTAPREVLAARLAARGRETRAEVERRLARADLAAPTGADVTEIDNGGALGDAVAALLRALAPPPGAVPGEQSGGPRVETAPQRSLS